MLSAACGSTETSELSRGHQVAESVNSEVPATTAPRVVDGFFSGEGAPDPRACQTPSDCIGDTIPDPENPCCNNPRSLRPYSRAYRQWIGEWRAAECEEVQCPPPPSPAMPVPCNFEMQCIEGTCANQC